MINFGFLPGGVGMETTATTAANGTAEGATATMTHRTDEVVAPAGKTPTTNHIRMRITLELRYSVLLSGSVKLG